MDIAFSCLDRMTAIFILTETIRVNIDIVMMTIQQNDLAGRPGPTYRALADLLAESIGSGRLPPGEHLPPQRDLAYRLGVSIGTVGRAYDLLAQRGLARGEVGRGTVVIGRGEPLRVATGEVAEVGGLIDLTSNFPAPIPAQAMLGDVLPIEEAAVDVLTDLLRYPDAAGARRHREAASTWLRHLGLTFAEPDRLLLTNGTEGALAAAMLAVARPGDTILTEQLCYSGLRTLAGRLGQHLEPVAMDEEGLVPEALAAAARQRGARVLVLSPSLQNPTAILTPFARREAIAAVARELDLTVVEDDVYGPLVPDRPAAIATLAPERTLYVTSLSKFLAPGLRLGFACGPAELVRTVVSAQRDLSLGHAPLAGEVFSRALAAGVVAEALRQQRLEMIERQQLASDLLAGLDLRAQPTALHVWLYLPPRWTSGEASLALARQGVLVAPADRFFIGRGAPPQAVRISLSAPATRAHLRSALERVATVLAMDANGRATGGLV
jgi:DNA-binding transcriptional MocR family regulator